MLEEVFVPLELSGYVAESHRSNPDGLRIWDLIRRSRKEPTFRQMLIQAQGGFGKTTLLRHVSLIYGQGKYRHYKAPKLIPFLLRLRDFRSQLAQEVMPTLPELIKQHYLPGLLKRTNLVPPPKWVEQLLQNGEALVMLDGFDELAEDQRKRASYWISEQMSAYDLTTFILTSRPVGYRDYEAKRPSLPLFVQKFNSDQQERFIRRWYVCQERCARGENKAAQEQAKRAAERNAQNLLDQLRDPNRPELQQMAENPLLLNMLATFHRFDPGVQLPQRRAQLYQGICKLQLDDRPGSRGIPMLLEQQKSQRVLQSLALQMVTDNTSTVSRLAVIAFLQKNSILQQEVVDAEAFLKQMEQISELLVEREAGEYEFPHLSFQSYLAAMELLGQSEQQPYALQVVGQNWKKGWWRETLLLLMAQLDPQKFINIVNEATKPGAAAQFAYDCLREYRKPDRLPPALKEGLEVLAGHVQIQRYKQLEEYLENEQWKEADQETYRLMITTVGKEEGQWFDSEKLLNFPCEELKAIDGLWVKHSDGHFGFSVQKNIYLSERHGGRDDGRFHEEAWNKFCHKIGWQRRRSYIPIKYDLRSPHGHLPAAVLRYQEGDGYFVYNTFTHVISLLSHLNL
jgi:predicted NACHT family NTPase